MNRAEGEIHLLPPNRSSSKCVFRLRQVRLIEYWPYEASKATNWSQIFEPARTNRNGCDAIRSRMLAAKTLFSFRCFAVYQVKPMITIRSGTPYAQRSINLAGTKGIRATAAGKKLIAVISIRLLCS